jgi:arsenate reductase (thioredoxin)
VNPRGPAPRPRHGAVERKRNVLFVCIGNICRSPMAEAFANHYGSDVLRASSAGLAPAVALSPHTRKVMLEKNVDIGNHLPRSLDELDTRGIDLIVNMSGYAIPGMQTVDWVIADPYGGPIEGYRAARDRIELQVMNLILKMRTGKI